VVVDANLEAGGQGQGGAELLHDSRPGDHVAGGEPGPPVDRGGHRLLGEADRPDAGAGAVGVAVAGRAGRLVRPADRPTPVTRRFTHSTRWAGSSRKQ
jgi:hypothetical protein